MTIEFDSITSDPGSGRPPRRAVAILGASMLVAAAGGVGFGLGMSAGSDDSTIAPTDTTLTTETPDAAVADTVAPPGTSADDGGAVEREEAIESVEPATVSDIASSGSEGWTVFGNEPSELLAERVTSTGITLRAHLGQLWDTSEFSSEDFGGPDGWQPPGWCFESGQVRIAMSGAATGTPVIDVGSVSWWSEPFDGRAVSPLVMGNADDNPHRVVFVQAPPDVTAVTVTFGDGATDSVAPSNGVALLVVPGAPLAVVHEDGGDYTWTEWTWEFDVTFEEEGSEPTTIAGAANVWNDPDFAASCSPPPPALPEPGEQPADPDADEQTVVELMTAIYAESDSELNAERIDDPTGIAEAREQVRDGGFADAADSASAIVEELVFTSPTEAWFRYRIETTTGTFGQRFGIARNIDGTWKITRDTICQDLSLAGGDCGDSRIVTPPST